MVRKLYWELGYPETDAPGPDAAWLEPSHTGPWGGSESAGLVPRMRVELAKLAWIANGEGIEDERAILAALGGTELVMRAEIEAGRPEAIADHLPGFVFTLTYSGLGRRRAIELARQAADMIAAERSGD